MFLAYESVVEVKQTNGFQLPTHTLQALNLSTASSR